MLYLYVTACRRRRFGGRVTQRHRGSDVAARGFPLTSSSPMKSSARLRNCKEDKYRVRVPGLRARNTAALTRCTKQSDGRKCVINIMASGVCAPRPCLAALLPLSNFYLPPSALISFSFAEMSFRGDVHLRIALMFGVALECGNWEMVASMGKQRRGWRRVRRAAGRGVAALGRADDSWSLHFFHTQITNVNRTRCSRSGTHSYTCTWLGIVILLERRVLLQELSG